jgi:hypothetical protein
MQGTCTSEPWTDDATCESCLESNCCFALNACQAGSDCLAFKDCADACGIDLGCASACTDMHETGVAAIEALAACNGDSCEGCATLPQTDFSCGGILRPYQGLEHAACAEASCCDEVVACPSDPDCDLEAALTRDCASGTLCQCVVNNCAF